MRLLIVTAISMLMLISSAFAQGNSYPDTSSDRATAAEGETRDLEEEGQQLDETAAPPRSSPDLESVEQRHPKWFKETNPYKPCPWDMCPSPPPQ
jgi:hypothetical protein